MKGVEFGVCLNGFNFAGVDVLDDTFNGAFRAQVGVGEQGIADMPVPRAFICFCKFTFLFDKFYADVLDRLFADCQILLQSFIDVPVHSV